MRYFIPFRLHAVEWVEDRCFAVVTGVEEEKNGDRGGRRRSLYEEVLGYFSFRAVRRRHCFSWLGVYLVWINKRSEFFRCVFAPLCRLVLLSFWGSGSAPFCSVLLCGLAMDAMGFVTVFGGGRMGSRRQVARCYTAPPSAGKERNEACVC